MLPDVSKHPNDSCAWVPRSASYIPQGDIVYPPGGMLDNRARNVLHGVTWPTAIIPIILRSSSA